MQDRLILELARVSADTSLHLGAVLTFDGPPPGADRLAAHLEARLAGLPELTFRLAGTARRPRWEPDPCFDVRRQLHVYDLPDGRADDPDRVLTAMLGQPLRRDRPLWGVWLVRGAGGYALCYRAHHAFQDGLAAAETCERLFGPPPVVRPRRKGEVLPAVPEQRGRSRRSAVWRDLLPPVRRTARWSPLDRPLSGERVVTTADVELARLHTIGRATGASVNQVCLAAVTATLRAWHPADWSGTAVRDLRATLAINVRSAHEPYRLLGNRGGIANIALPCGEPVPLRALAELREQVTFARLADLGRRHRVLYQKMPYWCGHLGLGRSIDPRYTPLTVADVRMRKPLGFAGQPARTLHPLPVSVPGQPLFIAWSTHRGRLHTTFLADAAVRDHRELSGRWYEAVDALESAVRAGCAP
ncbi:hypothetical protein SCATT_56100 [Streptantibioticus cattleyicolor NRRL 8057 = DSM 46488]|uniref:diacylglycerol O-acyltransferase n=1 Tax=Streptantibioticus cattleyicolor (strain ATCC 35852 / DSM 46488 / JCM 4925 / NBRC 14057 / NRRL 8057) TaxID=1003195 RepID=G8X1B3_STREN|nr:hypothetical protein SCATT_56100 [Streptantibioticus cattleyicolor NRRL 8057 = DSM 46488]